MRIAGGEGKKRLGFHDRGKTRLSMVVDQQTGEEIKREPQPQEAAED